MLKFQQIYISFYFSTNHRVIIFPQKNDKQSFHTIVGEMKKGGLLTYESMRSLFEYLEVYLDYENYNS